MTYISRDLDLGLGLGIGIEADQRGLGVDLKDERRERIRKGEVGTTMTVRMILTMQ